MCVSSNCATTLCRVYIVYARVVMYSCHSNHTIHPNAALTQLAKSGIRLVYDLGRASHSHSTPTSILLKAARLPKSHLLRIPFFQPLLSTLSQTSGNRRNSVELDYFCFFCSTKHSSGYYQTVLLPPAQAILSQFSFPPLTEIRKTH